MEKIYNENELNFLLKKKGSQNLVVKANCRICGLEFETKLKRLKTGFLCRKCKISETKKNKTEEEKQRINEKRIETCKEKYGVENVFQLNEVKEKSKETLEKEYGVSNPRFLQLDSNYVKKTNDRKQKEIEEVSKEKLDENLEKLSNLKLTKWDEWTQKDINEITEKRKATCKEIYGVEFAQQSEEVKKHYKENSLKNWGFESPQQSPEVKEKTKNTVLQIYGVESTFSLPAIREKSKKTCLKRYGVENPMQSQIVKDKLKKTYLERYGIAHAPSFKYFYQNERFDSSWELAVWIWAKDNGKEIEREPVSLTYTFNGIEHTYFPDFRLDGKLIEIKGPQFFKDGKMVNPFDHTQDDLFEAKHQCGLQNGVEFWGKDKMKPILNYIEEKYTKDFLNLFRLDLPFPYPELKALNDFNVIRFFHKSLYKAFRKGNKSPLEAWQDKGLVLKSALNRLRYVHKCTPRDIVQGFNVAKIAPKVSIFKPSLAEELIQKYLKDFKTVVDPFSGFSGRMVGAFRKGKKYFGWDINEEHVKESNEIKDFLKLENVEIEVEDLIKAPVKSFNEAALFTCPPYGDKEHWDENEVEKSCDEWIDLCLEKYKCSKYLFVVDKTEKYKENVVETLTNKSHFGKNQEYVILI